jgi:hypothetical protein
VPDRTREAGSEPAELKEVQSLLDHLVGVHGEGMRIGKHEEIVHALDACPLHRNLAVVRAGNDLGKPGIEEAVSIAGDDAQRKGDRPQRNRSEPPLKKQLITRQT